MRDRLLDARTSALQAFMAGAKVGVSRLEGLRRGRRAPEQLPTDFDAVAAEVIGKADATWPQTKVKLESH